VAGDWRGRQPEWYAGVCGAYWEGSAWYEALPFSCASQEEVVGQAACPIRLCAKRRRVEHCGLCVHYPCQLLLSFAARGGGDDLRVFSAARRAEYGDRPWAHWAREQFTDWLDAYCPLRELAAGRQGSARQPGHPDG